MAVTLALAYTERNDQCKVYKKCNKCLEVKETSNFSRKTKSKDGLLGVCKVCRKEYDKTRYKENPDYHIKYAKEHRSKNPYLHRKSQLKRLYNITLEEYNELFNLQIGCCAICGKHQSKLNRPLCIDHDHATNKIRGLLCKNCNSGIGLLQENKTVLYKAVEYLDKSTLNNI